MPDLPGATRPADAADREAQDRTCPFCHPAAERIFHVDDQVLGLWDGYPLADGHALLVPKRHVARWSETTVAEKAALLAAVDPAMAAIEQHHQPDGYNLGLNDGEAAGQTVPHLHLHVIPRTRGDVADPRGGVRWVLPARAAYWRPAEDPTTRRVVTSESQVTYGQPTSGATDPSTHRSPPPFTGPAGGPVGHAVRGTTAADPRSTTAATEPIPGLPHAQALIRGGQADALLPHLTRHLETARGLDLAVAFITGKGLDAIEQTLRDLLTRGARARILTGDYGSFTDPDALQRLLDLREDWPDESRLLLRVFQTTPGTSFHPKAYIFHGPSGPRAALVGSSNLTETALTRGLEWNYRVVDQQDRPGLEDVAQGFEELLQRPEVRPLDQAWIDGYRARRRKAQAEPIEQPADTPEPPPQPHDIQQEALEALARTREEGNAAGLVVLATGLGKTWLSAFDSREFKRVLFVAHREEILGQAQRTFRRIRPEARLGRFTGTEKTPDAEVLFASIQTLGKIENLRQFDRKAFDYIVVDEFHHAAAPTYRRLIDWFDPRFLLGLTATPERTDGGDLFALCGENLVYTCNLTEGIRRELLCPYRYFGVPDEVDYSNIPWRSHRFDEEALTKAVATQKRAQNALEQYQERAGKRTLAFCCSTRHADFMAAYFQENGIRAVAVHSAEHSAPRQSSLERLQAGELDVLFAVDMFNEGVDLPAVDTILMLRPTESKILWIQQFGRGLRTADGKDHLRVIDYIGNHRVFLLKPQTLFGLRTGDHEIGHILDRYEAGQLELPPGCEVTYDLESVEILRSLLRTRTTDDSLLLFYDMFLEQHGRRPQASEAFHEGYTPRAARKSHGSWLGFVQSRGGLTPNQEEVLDKNGAFLEVLESTPMTKSFKMVVLEAMLNQEVIPGPIDLDTLVEETRILARRSPRLREDFGIDLDDTGKLKKLLEENPIAAWSGGKGTRGTSYFAYQNGVLRSQIGVHSGVQLSFRELVREIVDWRLAEYLARTPDPTADTFTCKVSHAGGKPILFLPDREQHPGLPEGWTEITANDEPYQANFVKVAVNVVRKGDSETNELPDLLRGWFGPQAGRPGTNWHVLFERTDSGYTARPAEKAGEPPPGKKLEIGGHYRREEIPPLFGMDGRGQMWQSGVVSNDNIIILFVTLEKAGLPEEHRYKDHFLSADRFQWQSQNRTPQKGKMGQRIRHHEQQGIPVHLFCRKQPKIEGRAAPVIYCGKLRFLSWEGEKPITVQWELRRSLSDVLASGLVGAS